MRIHRTVIMSLAAAFLGATVLLAFFGQSDLAVYFIVYTIVYLIIMWFNMNLNPKSVAAVKRMTAVMFATSAFVMAFKIIEILG